MSGRIKLAALAAVLSVVSVHGTASAQNYFPAFPPAHQHQSHKAVNRFKAKIPSNAFGMAQTFDRLDVNKSGELEREELRHLDDPDWIVCKDLGICYRNGQIVR